MIVNAWFICTLMEQLGPCRLCKPTNEHGFLVKSGTPRQTCTTHATSINWFELRIPIALLVALTSTLPKLNLAIFTGYWEDKTHGFGGELDVGYWRVDMSSKGETKAAIGQDYVFIQLFLFAQCLIVSDHLLLLVDIYALIHTTGGNGGAKLRVGPSDAPNGTIVLGRYLRRAYPLVGQSHLVSYLSGQVRTICHSCTCVAACISEIDIRRPLPYLYVLITWAGRDAVAEVIELDIVDEIVVL